MNLLKNKSPSKLEVEEQKAYVAGFLYTTQKMVHSITEKSGPLTSNNEYQVHYEAVNFRFTKEGNFIDITIPSVVYNYPQEVSHAAISFKLKDVIATREIIKPLVEAKTKEIVSKFNPQFKQFAEKYGLELTVFNTAMSNIHRHPGGMSSFSGTDYDTNPDNPGIVFPYKSANMAPIYSSIILHREYPVLAHTEYRVANKIDDTITYYKGSCYTYCKGFTKPVPAIYSFFMETTTTVPSFVLIDGDTPNHNNIADIGNIFSKTDYEPSIDCVVSTNLETKKYEVHKHTSYLNGLDEYDDTDSLETVRFNKSYTNPYSTHKKTKYIPHIGKLPLLTNLVDKSALYSNKVFTTKYGKFLGSDLVDAWMDIESGITASVLVANEEPRTIEDLLDILGEAGVLDLYEFPYNESKAAGGK